MQRHRLDALFKPESVAVIGASPRQDSFGRALLENLLDYGFLGKVFPINPRHEEILGLPCYPSLAAVGQAMDLAVIAVPIARVPQVMAECGAAGVGTAVILSTGGREVGPEGEKLEAAIREAAAPTGIRYLGPSSWGVFCPPARLAATFSPHCAKSGNLAFISQSGALCSSILGWATQKNIGFSHFISVGSKGDLDYADLIDYLGNQESARSIIIYMENLTWPRKFMSAARSVSRVKPIIVVKSGRGPAQDGWAASFPEALAGEDAAYEAAFRRAGIVRVDTVGQLFRCAEALGKMPPPVRGDLGVITNAWGPGLMAVDALARWGAQPAPLAPDTLAQLNAILPAHWNRGNPIDLLGDAAPERFAQAVRVAMQAPELAGLVIILSPLAMTEPTQTARAVVAEVKPGRPVFAVWMGGDEVAGGLKILNEAGIPTLETPEQAVDTFMEMYSYSRRLKVLQETPPRLPREITVNTRQARAYLDHCLEEERWSLTELESKAILAAYGIPTNLTVAAATAADAVREAKNLGFPVVLKLHSPDIRARADGHGIRFSLHNEGEVLAAYEHLMAEGRERHPEAVILGVTVQAQEPEPDCELLLGCRQDPDFGPLLLFGLGGVMAEVLQDWAVDLPPLNVHLARSLIQKPRVHRLLQGFRDLPPANLDLLCEILVRLSQLVTDFPEIMQLDVNPLMVIGGRFVAVDARMTIRPSSVPAPRHLIIAPYPNQYERDWMLRDGTPVLLRPMKPEDEPLVFNFLQTCSDDTLYFRYFRRIKNWTHEMLVRFTQNDYDREIGLMAVGQPPGPEVMMGVSRLVMDADRQTAEFAIIVADPWQGKGLGPRLVQGAIDIARDQGVKRLYGDVLPQNQPMLDLARRLGFAMKRRDEIMRLQLEL
jgi:acetyltransferase